MIAVALHPVWCNIFAIKLDWKLEGIATAGLISNTTTFVIMSLFFWLDKELGPAVQLPDKRST